MDDGLGEAGGVKLNADGFLALVERDGADSVDLTQAGESEDCMFCGRDGIAVEDIHGGHISEDTSGGG